MICDLSLLLVKLIASGLERAFELPHLPLQIIVRGLLGVNMFDVSFEAVVALGQCLLQRFDVRLQLPNGGVKLCLACEGFVLPLAKAWSAAVVTHCWRTLA